MSTKSFSLLFALLLVGCTSVPEYKADVRQNFSAIQDVKPVSLEASVPAPKPEPVFEEQRAILDVQQMRALYTLVKQNKEQVAERNQLLALSNKLVFDRNMLLRDAQQEEKRANELSVALEEERDTRASEQRAHSVERTVGVSLLSVLLVLLVI